ncbi:MAG: hypothetical protein ACFBWO_17555 [Paracoccaceae bacterium]
MDFVTLLQAAAVGAVLGSIGQALRVAVGLRKAMRAHPGQRVGAVFSLSHAALGLFLGAAAGCLTALVALDPASITSSAIIAVVAAGYAGADAIEGMLNGARGTEPPAAASQG